MSNTQKSSERLLCGVLLALSAFTSAAVAAPTNGTEDAAWSTVRLNREFVGPDDWRGFNRAMFWIDDAVMDYVADPFLYLYCSIVPRPLIDGIENAVDNSEYPVRLVSTLCRAEWAAAWDDTCRFVINSTVGLGGLFDPAQNWCGIISSDASMSGTLAAWGVPKGKACVIPSVPRANVRDDCGYILDQGLDPKTYIGFLFPTGYSFIWTTMFWPNYGAVWIDPWQDNITPASDRYASFRQFIAVKSLLDEDLAVYRYATDFVADRSETRRPPVRPAPARPEGLRGRWRDIPDYAPRTPALDSMRALLFAPKRDKDFWWTRHSVFNGDFATDVRERTVTLATNLPAAHYGFVPAPEGAAADRARRLVFVIPGIGGTHASRATLALAEFVRDAGTAVVLCDNTFHWQYMLSGNRGVLPGYLPDDARRYADFIRAVLADLKAEGLADDPEVSVVGWSMGGLLASHLAVLADGGDLGFRTGRFVAANPPVSFDSIERAMDLFLEPSRGWSAAEARTNLVRSASRLLVWNDLRDEPVPDLSEADARHLVALALGNTLPDLVGLVTHTNGDVSVRDYFHRYAAAARPDLDAATFARQAGLLALEDGLRKSARLSLIHTRDDFLLSNADRDYLDRVLGDRITWFAVGGHCGMFYTKEFRNEVLERLDLLP